MDNFDKEQEREMRLQVNRYERFLKGEDIWFDSDNYVDIIDWYFNNDMFEQAEEVTLRAYELFPNNEEIISRYTTYLANHSEYQKAIDITKQALDLYDSDELRLDLASLYIDSNKNIDVALDILLDILQRDEENYFIYMLIGRIFLERDNLINAEKYLHKAVELNYEDRMTLGCYTDCAFEPSLQDNIINLLFNLSREHPFMDIIWCALGIVYSRYKLFDLAIEAFDYAIVINPKGEIRHACKADCLIAKKDYANAKKELDLAIDNAQNYATDLHLVYAGILIIENDYAKALLHLKQVDDDANDIFGKTYLLDMALCYYFLDDPSSAITCVQRAYDENIDIELIIDFARKVYDYGFENHSEDIFEMLFTTSTDDYTIELASTTLAALKSRDGHTFEAIKIMENTLAELHSCTEDFWYAFLRITCQDQKFDSYTTKTLKILSSLDSFPIYIKEHYPEIIDNPNYKRCLKQIHHV